jgi:pimeloyl-ACP methyl ester carboxylesterase
MGVLGLVIFATKRAMMEEGMAKYGYPSNAGVPIFIVEMICVISLRDPAHRGARCDPADRLPRRCGGDARPRGRAVVHAGHLRSARVARNFLARSARPGAGSAPPDLIHRIMRNRIMTTLISASTILATVGCATRQDQQSGYAPVHGLRMYYEIHGAPRKDAQPPLVLLHGGGSTIETSFAELLPRLSRDRQVIAFEQQGHGRTADILDRPFTFEQSADDTVALLDYLKIDRADVYGFSNGGTIALQIARRHPQRVRKLIAASATVKKDGMPPEFWDGMRHATLQSMPKELRDAYTRTAPHPEQLQSFHDKSVKRMLDFKDWSPQEVAAIKAPTLVIIGDRDVVRPEHAVEMYRQLPRAELAIMPNTDHATIMMNADRATWQCSIIESFLNEE